MSVAAGTEPMTEIGFQLGHPYADGARYARRPFVRLDVPGHGGDALPSRSWRGCWGSASSAWICRR